MAKLLFWEVIDEMCKNIGKEKMTEIQELLDIGAAEMENTVNSTVRDIALWVMSWHTCRLVWTFTGCICLKDPLSLVQPICNLVTVEGILRKKVSLSKN